MTKEEYIAARDKLILEAEEWADLELMREGFFYKGKFAMAKWNKLFHGKMNQLADEKIKGKK